MMPISVPRSAQFKRFVAGNHKPAIRNIDEAMKRRLYLQTVLVKNRIRRFLSLLLLVFRCAKRIFLSEPAPSELCRLKVLQAIGNAWDFRRDKASAAGADCRESPNLSDPNYAAQR